MAGYVKIWTTLCNKPEFLCLSNSHRGIYLQLLLWCKNQGDSGILSAGSWSHFSTMLSCHPHTLRKAFSKLKQLCFLDWYETDEGAIVVKIPKYRYWQDLQAKEVAQKDRERLQSIFKNAPIAEQSRAEQSRAEQSIYTSPQKSATPNPAKTSPQPKSKTTTDTDGKPPPKTKPVPDSDHHRAIAYFCDMYLTTTGVKYDFKSGKDAALVKRLLKTYGLQTFKQLTDQLFASTDPFIMQTDRGIGVLSACSNKLMQEIRNKDAPLQRLSPAGQTSWHNLQAVLKRMENEDDAQEPTAETKDRRAAHSAG
jgi:DNA-binding transcriptional regulator YhcF (GntR family)